LVENYLEAGGSVFSIEHETALSWLAQIQSVISNLAIDAGTSVREFACTLMVAVVGLDASAFLQVGDGAMVVRKEGDDGWSYVFWPQHGEYINSTNFVTSSDAFKMMEFARPVRRIESFSCFSDGIESLVLHYATKTVHDPFFNAMIEPVRASTAVVAVDQTDFTFERAIILQFGPAITVGWLHFVVSLPAELDGIAVARTMDEACETIEGELAADLIKQDVGARHGHVVALCLDDTPSAQDAHAGATRSLGSRTRL
jgi:hypothetical protein